MYKFYSFEYMPGIIRDDSDVYSKFTKINSGTDESGVYEVSVPSEIRQLLIDYTDVSDPVVVFLPHFRGFHNLVSSPESCPGEIAIQVVPFKISGAVRLDFAGIIQCMAEPVL